MTDSMPCWSLFDSQPQSYRKCVLPEEIPSISIEAGTTLGWRPYSESAASAIGVDHFGASAPGEVVMRKYGFTAANVCQTVHAVVDGRQCRK
jgi:transketolase